MKPDIRYKYLFIYLLCAINAGCGSFTLHRDDVIGRWQVKDHGAQGEIVLSSDGKIIGKGIPIEAMCDRNSAEKPQILKITSDVSGEWILDDSIGELRLSMYDPTNNHGCGYLLYEDGFTKRSGRICNSQNYPSICYTLSKL